MTRPIWLDEARLLALRPGDAGLPVARVPSGHAAGLATVSDRAERQLVRAFDGDGADPRGDTAGGGWGRCGISRTGRRARYSVMSQQASEQQTGRGTAGAGLLAK